MLRSMQAVWRDLPQLLENRRNHKKWAAYHGDERVTVTRSDGDAYRECFRRGRERGEFYVGLLEADPEGIPPWGTFEGDWSLYKRRMRPRPRTHEDPRSTADLGGAHLATVWRSVHYRTRQGQNRRKDSKTPGVFGKMQEFNRSGIFPGYGGFRVMVIVPRKIRRC